jgi:hypothetical protein
MKKILILSVFYFVSCQNNKCDCNVDNAVVMQNDSSENKVINNPNNQFKNYWKRFDEPDLSFSQSETYRFSIKIYLYDYMKVYRLEKNNNNYKIFVKEYATKTTTAHRNDSLVSDKSRIINESDWLKITNVIENNCFWTIPTDIKKDDGYLDGSSWILEGHKQNNNCSNKQYHLAYRNSPDSSAFKIICEQFIELDSLNIRHF